MWNEHVFMTRAQMREYDRLASARFGVPGIVLMENAGRGAARVAAAMVGGRRRVAVVCGPGNNGGDGFVAARHLAAMGFEVRVLLAAAREAIKGDALANLAILEASGEAIENASGAIAAPRLAECDLVVDALLGTGVSRKVEGPLADLIDAVNASGVRVLALDVPSGLDADTGRPCGVAVRATATCTFGHLKRGLVVHPGVDLAGRIHVVPLGAPAAVTEMAGIDGVLLSEASARALLPRREADTHKGIYGHLLVVAGSLGKTGAAVMAGQAAMRAGAGLVTIATTVEARSLVESRCVEVMVEALGEESIDELLDGKRAVALGPGLSTAEGVREVVSGLLRSLEVPAVIDADGLNILASEPGVLGRVGAPLVLTPHPGEMSRLTGRSVADIQNDRVGAAREAAAKLKTVIVLKGARTVIAATDGRVFVNPTGNPGMASGGMGDVLTGLVGGFLAQGVSTLDAALLAVYLHGFAGDRAAARLGQHALVATDVLAEIPTILRDWEA
ncbi:MAG: NAD(P)H-hydrate dehydratase [Deltaproteobacteria bacterium]|nr:NAD(P)H-hydrate dehydratase [Deltaproteobacteria bacterium]